MKQFEIRCTECGGKVQYTRDDIVECLGCDNQQMLVGTKMYVLKKLCSKDISDRYR